jgi:methionyl-tRNA formyltransferase
VPALRGLKDQMIALFAYNFPHRKTTDFLLHLAAHNVAVTEVIAADPVKLNIPTATVRTKVRQKDLVHPADVARRLGISYTVLPHNSPEIAELVRARNIELGVVAGARILPGHVIEAFPRGIINFHPGLIPETRGLDALLWSVYRDLPIGVTAHLIDTRVDAGALLIRQTIQVAHDDTIFDLSEKLYGLQLELLLPAIEAAVAGKAIPIADAGAYNRKMPAELEAVALAMAPDYIRRHAAVAVAAS